MRVPFLGNRLVNTKICPFSLINLLQHHILKAFMLCLPIFFIVQYSAPRYVIENTNVFVIPIFVPMFSYVPFSPNFV